MKRSLNMLFCVAPVAIAVALTIGSGVAQSWFRERSSAAGQMDDGAALLKKLPETIGDWQLVSNQPLGESALRILQCSTYLNQTFVNQKTGAVVTLAVLLGPTRSLSQHTPEVCYTSREYRLIDEPSVAAVALAGGRESEFRVCSLQSTDVDSQRLLIYYAWHDGRGWRSPMYPRLAFRGSAYLYKVQLAASVHGDAGASEDDVCRAFLKEFIPVMDRHVVDPDSLH